MKTGSFVGVWLIALGVGLFPTQRGHADSLMTEYTNGFSNGGIMFDVTATHAIQITGFQVGLIRPEPFEVALYTRLGTHVGSENAPGAWTSVGAQTLVGTAGQGPSSVYACPSPIAMAAGERRALYILDTSANKVISFSAASAPGAVVAEDDFLSIFAGTSMNSLFGILGSNSRLPNVTLYYRVVDLERPFIKLFGRRHQRVATRRTRVRGRATSVFGIRTVIVRFQRLRADGSRRTVTRRRNVSARGIFWRRIPVLPGRINRVRARAVDDRGRLSRTVVRVIVPR